MKYSGLSSKGRVRGSNEDFFHVPFDEKDVALFIVADGMGGENAGEVASSLAVASMAEFVRENYASASDIRLLLRQAMNEANKTVYQTARSDKSFESMGTTVVATILKDGLVYVANVGDSRCYMLRNGRLKQISVDHSYVQEMVDKGMLTPTEAQVHPNRNLITRAIGVERFVEVDVFCQSWEPQDKLLLATDGLTGMLSEQTILEIVDSGADCREITQRLIQAANEAGGKDNITAVFIAND